MTVGVILFALFSISMKELMASRSFLLVCCFLEPTTLLSFLVRFFFLLSIGVPFNKKEPKLLDCILLKVDTLNL